jgi:hypothetical protein
MRRLFRAFLMWMVMLAVPLQGIAATTMLLCGPGHGGASHASAEPATHVHGDHRDADAADETSGLETKGKCSACASCCSAVALLAGLPTLPAAEPAAGPRAAVEPGFEGVVADGLKRPPRTVLA